ncbi:MAG: hypothetical protein EBY21_10740 [Alphaproteobacteria bacterium]|nr:hypothetical protein [Alphaproteobacteria bacterium]
MHKKQARILFVGSALLPFLLMPMAQAAQVKSHIKQIAKPEPRSLLIQKRSFLDSGTIVPIGSMSNYKNDSTILHVPIYRQIFPSRFGGDVLPGRFDLSGRPVPLFTF